MTFKLELEGGKYTVLHENGCNFRALRNGEPWRSLVGDGLVLAMCYRIEELQEQLEKLQRVHPGANADGCLRVASALKGIVAQLDNGYCAPDSIAHQEAKAALSHLKV
ncbi:hypothetical protein D3C81_365300 [compost metagenome]